jgi:zinc/manganese transport system substrate-binding protein
MKTLTMLFTAALLACTGVAHAALDVFACEPEWGALVVELAGNRAKVFVATTALQDVHRIQARPSLIARARTADLVVCTGADLEVGWLRMVINQSGNDKVQLGKPGYLEVANVVPRIEIPAVIDRALGDVHPMGNPHIQFGPTQIQLAAEEITKRLVRLDPANEAEYRTRLDDFRKRWKAATERWSAMGAPLKGVRVVQHHKNYSYLFEFLDMKEVGTLEPKPGVEPTSSHLNELVARQQTDPARLIVRSSYQSPAASEWLAQRIAVPAIMLPATVGGTDAAKDLFSLYDDAIQRMLNAGKS